MNTGAISARFQLDYGHFRLDADITLPGSGISVLFGESGTGKTTLLRCMAGLERPPQGYFRINGTVWQDSGKNLFVPAHQRNLGYVFQDANLFPHLTVTENLQFGLNRITNNQSEKVKKTLNTSFDRLSTLVGIKTKGKRLIPYVVYPQGHKSLSNHEWNQPARSLLNKSPVIELLGIGHLLDRMPDSLSGGEKQRAAIARALVLNPYILLMDEPLASLDEKRKREVMPYLLKLQRELDIPIVYVTHSRQEVMQLADHLVILENGRVQAVGSLPDMLSRLDLPLSQEREAASVWQGKVIGYDSEFQLANVEFNGVSLSLPNIDAGYGTRLRVRIQARDVSIALQKPGFTSILNVLPATITGLADDQGGHTVVRLQCGREILLAHITRKSAQLLELQQGKPVFAQIKGTSLLH